MIADGHRALYAVEPTVLKEDDWIIIFDASDEHSFGIRWKRGSDDSEAGDMREPRMQALRVLRSLSPTTTNHHADHDWDGAAFAIKHVIPLGCLIDDLLQAQQREIEALMRQDGAHASKCSAYHQPRERVFGKRSIQDAVTAKFVHEA